MDIISLIFNRLDSIDRKSKKQYGDAEIESARHILLANMPKTIEASVLEDIFEYWLSLLETGGPFLKLGDLASFLLAPEADSDLHDDDYRALYAIIKDHAEDMDIDLLTSYMSALLHKKIY